MVVLRVTNCALIVVITVVAVIGALTAGESPRILLVSRLAKIFTRTYQTQVVTLDTDRAHLSVETHIAFPETLSTHLSLVVKVSRERETSLSVRE